MRVLFATAELAPLARVGGLAAAAAGLVAELRRQGVTVDVVAPDYRSTPLEGESVRDLWVPGWAGPAQARTGRIAAMPEVGEITLVRCSGIERPHPYVDANGHGWGDNDHRFMAFSAAVASLVQADRPDVVHLNDWHTGAALAFLPERPPTVFTIHTLGYQGSASADWLPNLPYDRVAYLHFDACNPLCGAVRLSDLVITVSPTYAREVLTPEGGFGMDGELRARGGALVGILNGIDDTVWDPANDPALPAPFATGAMDGKGAVHDAVCDELGLERGPGPLIAVVTRLAEQKGIDLVVPSLAHLSRLPARLAVLGDGDPWLADTLARAAVQLAGRMSFTRGYDEGLAHRLFGAADLFLMPSRFEPCGLAQMQAMRYGALPVVTDVGGLHDTVIDVDSDPARGTGIVAPRADPIDVLDALHRGVRAVGNRFRRDAMRRRGMSADWSWRRPASEHIAHYERLVAARRGVVRGVENTRSG